MLYLIGIGLIDEKDISVKGLEAVKKAKYVYLENYTSVLQVSREKLEKFYGKEIGLATRDLVENHSDEIFKRAVNSDVAFLVVGGIFGATTHIDFVLRAREKGIKIKYIHGASILSAVGVVGLELYKYGKITSIPFENKNVKTPLEVLKMNKKMGLHTLILLDLDVKNDKFMTIPDACDYLLKNKIDDFAIGCAGIGSDEQDIKVGKISEIKDKVYNVLKPQCLIIPGKLHFMEEEALNQWK